MKSVIILIESNRISRLSVEWKYSSFSQFLLVYTETCRCVAGWQWYWLGGVCRVGGAHASRHFSMASSAGVVGWGFHPASDKADCGACLSPGVVASVAMPRRAVK
jgi:hypothetical protein